MKMVATLLVSVLVLHWDSLRGAFVPAGSILNTAPKNSGGGDGGGSHRGPNATRDWFVKLRFVLGFVLQLSECSVSV